MLAISLKYNTPLEFASAFWAAGANYDLKSQLLAHNPQHWHEEEDCGGHPTLVLPTLPDGHVPAFQYECSFCGVPESHFAANQSCPGCGGGK